MPENTEALNTPKGRFCYPNFFTMSEFEGKHSYNCSILVPKVPVGEKAERDVVRLARLRAIIKEIGNAKFGAKVVKQLTDAGRFYRAIKSAEEQRDKLGRSKDGYDDEHWLIAARTQGVSIPSDYPYPHPRVLRYDKTEIDKEHQSEVYGGGLGYLNVEISAWSNAGKSGVSLWLRSAMFLGGGERFGGGMAAEDAFDEESPEFDEDGDNALDG